ncbi:MAG: hypothetical protein O7A71_04410 [Chloroflexi bacterium]|nr:hypothetical protein [Chloroflexota bacterium]
MDEETVGKIRGWSDTDFDDSVKAALGYTERLFIDHQNIDREMFTGMQEHFSPEQIVELGWAIVSYMGYGRLIHSFGLTPGDHL